MINENEKKDLAQTEGQHTEKKEDIFKIDEIEIEEMAIDGICGVY